MRRPSWKTLLLGASLAVNLVVIGAIAGSILRHGGPPDRWGKKGGGMSMAAPYLRALPEAERQAIRKNVAFKRDPQLRKTMHQEITAALRAEPFSRDKIKATLDTQIAARLAHQEQVQTAWLDAVTKMSGAERAAYADRIEAYAKRRGNRHRAP